VTSGAFLLTLVIGAAGVGALLLATFGVALNVSRCCCGLP
jgi:hypothetical protein